MKQIKTKFFKDTENKYISYSWDTSPDISHKISGHLFEAIDFFLENRNYKILLPEISELRILQCRKAIQYKYRSDLQEVIFEAIIFGRPKLVICKELILCDGIPPASECIVDTMELWLCGRDFWWVSKARLFQNTFKYLTINYNKNIYDRYIPLIHPKIKDLSITLNKKFMLKMNDSFIKDINVSNYIKYENNNQDTLLIYATGNCRSLEDSKDNPNDIIKTIKQIKNVNTILLVGINPKDDNFLELFKNELDGYQLKIYTEDELPIQNFHNKFGKYLYTHTSKNWDCSSRLIRECYSYNKPIYFTKKVLTNLEDNTALKYLIDYLELPLKEQDEI